MTEQLATLFGIPVDRPWFFDRARMEYYDTYGNRISVETLVQMPEDVARQCLLSFPMGEPELVGNSQAVIEHLAKFARGLVAA